MFTNVDVRGVSRGHCTTNGCECDGFTRPSSLESSSIQAAPLQCGWCCYCGHSPVSHSRLVIPEVASSSPGISSVNWGCTVQTPFRDQATLVHSAREGRTELETARLASTSQLADVYPSKCEPASSPEPEPRAECEATPQSAAAWMRQESPLRHTPPQPESNSRPNATFVQESEPGSEPPRKRSCIEQGTEDEGWNSMSPTPTEACQEFSGCACGLGQKVEQLEHEKQDLMRQLTDAQNVAGEPQLVKEERGTSATISGTDAGGHSSELTGTLNEGPCCRSAEKLWRARKKYSALKAKYASMKIELGIAEKAAEPANAVRRLIEMTENESTSIDVIPCPKIHIGNGILIEEPKLRMLETSCSPGRLARALLRHLFTTEELKGKCLLGNRSKSLSPKEHLDPDRVNAILDYTCSKFPGTDVGYIKKTLSAVLHNMRAR